MKPPRRQQGFAAVAAVFVGGLFMLSLAYAATHGAISSAQKNAALRESAQARYTAESAAKETLYQMRRLNAVSLSGFPEMNESSVTISAEETEWSLVTIRATAEHTSARRTIIATVETHPEFRILSKTEE